MYQNRGFRRRFHAGGHVSPHAALAAGRAPPRETGVIMLSGGEKGCARGLPTRARAPPRRPNVQVCLLHVLQQELRLESQVHARFGARGGCVKPADR